LRTIDVLHRLSTAAGIERSQADLPYPIRPHRLGARLITAVMLNLFQHPSASAENTRVVYT